jgi:hypothetical protein
LYICSISSNDFVYRYDLSTPYDLTTATLSPIKFQYNFNTTPISNVVFGDNNLKMYASYINEGEILQFDFEAENIGSVLGAEELSVSVTENGLTTVTQWIYYATKDYLFRIKVSDVTNWIASYESGVKFLNGDDTYHPFVLINNRLYIGDKYYITQVDEFGSVTLQTIFSLPANETITALVDFDIDLLVGTKTLNSGRVLRWDGVSINLTSDDNIYVDGGVQAFLSDDNYRYVLDQEGTVWYYNGAQCEVFVRLPEVANGKIKINTNAVGFWRKTPVFGLSNGVGNTVLQGIYGIGKYSRGYSTTLSLDFPMPSNEFSNVEIGSLLVDGQDLYASWKDNADVGVAKLDYTAKYNNAYIETMALAEAENRHQLKTLSDVIVPYYSKPTNTNITIGIDKNYEGTFTNMVVIDDTKRKIIELKNPSVVDVANPRLRIQFTVSNNDSMEIEDVLYGIAPVGKI